MTALARISLVACAAIVAAALTASLPARAGDDDAKKAAELKAKRDRYREDLRQKGWWPYLDLSYGVDAKGASLDSRWSCDEKPPVENASEDRGVQLLATWSIKAGSGADIRFVVQKIQQADTAAQKVFTYRFDHAGIVCKVAEVPKMCEGFYKDFLAQSVEPDRAGCQEPRKVRGSGPADWYACATATPKDTQKRVRVEWFLWSKAGFTWVAEATYQAETLAHPEWLRFGADVMRATKPLDPPDR